MRPDLSRVGSFYHGYINQVKEDNISAAFAHHNPALFRFLQAIPADKIDYRYAEGKWTIREMVQHIIDAERIFAYRALRFARKDATPLPGFDENMYADNAKADKREWNELLAELKTVRDSSTFLFNSFDGDQLDSNGVSSNSPNYVLAIGYILIGHAVHHQHIIEERYL